MKYSPLFYYCLALILFFNSNLSLQYSNNQFAHTNASLNDETLLICTGKESILISSYEYFTNNKIVQVQSNDSTPQISYCPIDTLIEPTKLDLTSLDVMLFTRGAYFKVTERLRILFNLLTPVQHKLSRAPPIL